MPSRVVWPYREWKSGRSTFVSEILFIVGAEGSVGRVDGGDVGRVGERGVDLRVFRVEPRLVEIVGVQHPSTRA